MGGKLPFCSSSFLLSPPFKEDTWLVPRLHCFSKHRLEDFCTNTKFPLCLVSNMAVIGRCESGFLVDHKRSITGSVSPSLLTCKDTLFAVYEPYFRSSTEKNCEPNGKRKVT